MMDTAAPVVSQSRLAYHRVDFDENRVRWDEWLRVAEHGDAAQLSAHLASFRAYRANVHLHVVEDDGGAILAGAGTVSWKLPGIKTPFGVAPGGPSGDIKHWPLLLDGLSNWCRQQQWMCVEVCPGTRDENQQAKDSLSAAGFDPVGKVFAPLSSLSAELRVALAGLTEDQLLRSFRRQTRQHVSRSWAEGYELERPTAETDIQTAVDFFHKTTIENGIPFGPRNRFMAAVTDLVQSRTGYLALVRHGDRLLAGGVFVRAGKAHRCYRLVTKRDDEYRRAAYYLHWMAMLRARREGFDWYYLSGRSTDSVYQFKRGFRPQQYKLLAPHRLVFRPGLMRSIETVRPVAMKAAAGILGMANRLRSRK